MRIRMFAVIKSQLYICYFDAAIKDGVQNLRGVYISFLIMLLLSMMGNEVIGNLDWFSV